jgi:hypothetical protein
VISGCLYPFHPLPPRLGLVSGPLPPRPTAIPNRAAMAAVRWKPGQTVRVGFMNRADQWGATVRDAVRQHAADWEQWANIHFEFSQEWAPDINVNFSCLIAPHGTYTAYLGTDNRAATAASIPSCHLVFDPSDPANTDQELRRVILHEIGHWLGLIHEHMRPDRPILWNEPAVYQRYHELTGGAWDWPTIYQQIIAPYTEPLDGDTPFDPHGIMMYPFPPGLAQYEDGTPFEAGWNSSLSPADIALIQRMYPP